MTEFLPIILAGSLSAQKVQVGSFKECSAKHKYFLNLFLVWFCFALLAAAKSLQSCPTLCDPIDGSPPGSPVPGILQARTLEVGTWSYRWIRMHPVSLAAK